MAHNVSERKNLIHFLLLHPFHLARFIVKSTSNLFNYLMRRKVRKIRSKSIKRNFRPAIENSQQLYFERFPPVNRIEITNNDDFEEIHLAGRTVSSRQQIDWSHINDDIEDTFSLNRFGWLFTAIHTRFSKDLAQRSIEWITNWIDSMGESFHHPAWESYSISERLANWPFILRVIEHFQPIDANMEKKIVSTMKTHIEYLLQHLELRNEFTNNHILNNARGLYIGGVAVAHERAVEKAKALFIVWTPKLFHSDGMLKEGSSHYQFLLCQRFEQICLLSKFCGDDIFATFMRKWTKKIRKARDLFNIQRSVGEWSMPLIGDISPDYDPMWFSPFSIEGWRVIINAYAWDDYFTSCNKTTFNGLKRMCEGFYRYEQDSLTVFWHVPDGPVDVGSHSHFDVGGFVLFLKNKEIFTDSGRCSYLANGSIGMYAKAHNCLIIDGVGPFCEDYHLNLIGAYPYQMSHTIVTKNKDDRPILSLIVDGFRRLTNPVSWKRSFSFKERAMTIHDDIKARSIHRLTTRFIIAKGLSIEKIEEGICIKSENWKVTMKILNFHGEWNEHFFMERAEISRKYGCSETTLAFVVKNTIHGNHTNIYEIRW